MIQGQNHNRLAYRIGQFSLILATKAMILAINQLLFWGYWISGWLIMRMSSLSLSLTHPLSHIPSPPLSLTPSLPLSHSLSGEPIDIPGYFERHKMQNYFRNIWGEFADLNLESYDAMQWGYNRLIKDSRLNKPYWCEREQDITGILPDIDQYIQHLDETEALWKTFEWRDMARFKVKTTFIEKIKSNWTILLISSYLKTFVRLVQTTPCVFIGR